MKKMQILGLVALMAVSSLAMGQSKRDKNSDLEKLLWDADQEWLCAGPYQKPPKDCVESRANFWGEQFFEIGGGSVMSKAEMVASQTAAAPKTVPGTGLNGVFPGDFKLRAVYGNFALATDRTAFKTVDASGLPTFTRESRWLRSTQANTRKATVQVSISSIKGEVKKKHFSCGRNFSCFPAHWIEQTQASFDR